MKRESFAKRAKKQRQEIAREQSRVVCLAARLNAIIETAFRNRDRNPFNVRVWGDRAIDSMSRARRALDEARRYGSR